MNQAIETSINTVLKTLKNYRQELEADIKRLDAKILALTGTPQKSVDTMPIKRTAKKRTTRTMATDRRDAILNTLKQNGGVTFRELHAAVPKMGETELYAYLGNLQRMGVLKAEKVQHPSGSKAKINRYVMTTVVN